ncbi:MAG TPA: RNA polymerase sigma factor [Bacteroidales bacterium]|nr:RNA polymerase sigma factor [Bacteroidales bacterium]
MDAFSDNALMQKVKEGDVAKMGILFERHNRQLFRFMFNMTRKKELSEDMVQNVFLRMLKYPDGFRGFGEFRTWMYHVARNVLYDHFRKEKRSPILEDPENLEWKLQTEPAPDISLEKKDELENLERAIEMLSVENRELIVMCRFQELKYSDIAAILNTTEGAVKVRVHRAIGQLKTNFLNIEK